MRINIIVGTQVVEAELFNSIASQDLISQLPLKLKLEDFNRTEKIADLPKRLNIEGAPEGVEPKAGEITYYAPWGNLAIFYRDYQYAKGLVQLGVVTSNLSALITSDKTEILITPVIVE